MKRNSTEEREGGSPSDSATWERLERIKDRQKEARRKRREEYTLPRQEGDREAFGEIARKTGYALHRLKEGWVFKWPGHLEEEHDFAAIFDPPAPVKVNQYNGLRYFEVELEDADDEERYTRVYQGVLDRLVQGQSGSEAEVPSMRECSAWQEEVERHLEIREIRLKSVLSDLASVLKVYVTEAAAQDEIHRTPGEHRNESMDGGDIREFEIRGAIRSGHRLFQAGDEQAYLNTDPRTIDLLRLADSGTIANPPRERLPEGADPDRLLFLYRLHRSARTLWQSISSGYASDQCYVNAEAFFRSFPAQLLVEESTRTGVHSYGEVVRGIHQEALLLQDKRWAFHSIVEDILLDRPVSSLGEARANWRREKERRQRDQGQQRGVSAEEKVSYIYAEVVRPFIKQASSLAHAHALVLAVRSDGTLDGDKLEVLRKEQGRGDRERVMKAWKRDGYQPRSGSNKEKLASLKANVIAAIDEGRLPLNTESE